MKACRRAWNSPCSEAVPGPPSYIEIMDLTEGLIRETAQTTRWGTRCAWDGPRHRGWGQPPPDMADAVRHNNRDRRARAARS